jgi:FXSXX-COOH protein
MMADRAHRTDGHNPGTSDIPTSSKSADTAHTPDVPAGPGPLPDLLSLDLATLRTLDHPVLADVLADLRGRAEQPRETLWGFINTI